MVSKSEKRQAEKKAEKEQQRAAKNAERKAKWNAIKKVDGQRIDKSSKEVVTPEIKAAQKLLIDFYKGLDPEYKKLLAKVKTSQFAQNANELTLLLVKYHG